MEQPKTTRDLFRDYERSMRGCVTDPISIAKELSRALLNGGEHVPVFNREGKHGWLERVDLATGFHGLMRFRNHRRVRIELGQLMYDWGSEG